MKVVLDQSEHALMLFWMVVDVDHHGEPVAQQGVVADICEQHL